jgi:hypothetical protein
MGGQQAKLRKSLKTATLETSVTLEYIEDLRKSWIASDKKEIEILESLRLGSKDYDFNTVKKINAGG